MTTPAFWQFSGAYMHEDWPEIHGNEWAALEAFLVDDPSLAMALPAEIDRILLSHSSEAELEAFVESQGACFAPSPDSGGYRGWLMEVARRVRAAKSQT